jgi:hypothetical protein
MWDELEDMVRRNPNVAGIDLVDCEFDCGVGAELVEDYLNELNGEDIGF